MIYYFNNTDTVHLLPQQTKLNKLCIQHLQQTQTVLLLKAVKQKYKSLSLQLECAMRNETNSRNNKE